MQKLGLMNLFDAIVTGHDIKNAKPDSEIFLESGKIQPLPVDENKIIESGFDSRDIQHMESMFSLGNGYLGLRGTYDESDEGICSCDGMYINGVYGEKACFSNKNIKDHFRALDMRKGCIERRFIFETTTGKRAKTGGLHLACLGGVWMIVANGFLGMRHYEDGLSFDPQIPQAWSGYRLHACGRYVVLNEENSSLFLARPGHLNLL